MVALATRTPSDRGLVTRRSASTQPEVDYALTHIFARVARELVGQRQVCSLKPRAERIVENPIPKVEGVVPLGTVVIVAWPFVIGVAAAGPESAAAESMIPKSGGRFSEKIMLHQKTRAG
jgi:hypothetical protein